VRGTGEHVEAAEPSDAEEVLHSVPLLEVGNLRLDEQRLDEGDLGGVRELQDGDHLRVFGSGFRRCRRRSRHEGHAAVGALGEAVAVLSTAFGTVHHGAHSFNG